MDAKNTFNGLALDDFILELRMRITGAKFIFDELVMLNHTTDKHKRDALECLLDDSFRTLLEMVKEA